MTDAAVQDNNWTGTYNDVPKGTYYGNNWGGQPTCDWGCGAGIDHLNFDKRHNGGANVLWYDGHVKWLRSSLKDGKPYYWYAAKPTTP